MSDPTGQSRRRKAEISFFRTSIWPRAPNPARHCSSEHSSSFFLDTGEIPYFLLFAWMASEFTLLSGNSACPKSGYEERKQVVEFYIALLDIGESRHYYGAVLNRFQQDRSKKNTRITQ